MPLCLADLATISSFCLWCSLIAGCLGSQCTSSVSYPPSEEMSLCASRQVRLTKLAILPDNNCTCRLTINLHDRVRIAAKLDSSQPPDCSREAFVISNLATLVNIRQLCEMGTCEELGSQTERSVYVISYRSEPASAKTSLRLWLEVQPDANQEQTKAGVTLQCGLPPLQSASGPVKMNKVPTTSEWTVSTATITNPSVVLATSKRTGTTALAVTSKPSGRTSTSLPGSDKTSPSTTTLNTADNRTTTTTTVDTADNRTTSARDVNDATKPTSGVVESNDYWADVLRDSKFVISVSIALTLAVIIMVVTGAISYMMFKKKGRRHTGSRRRILKRTKKPSDENSSEGGQTERSDYGSVFRVSGTNTNDIRFQY